MKSDWILLISASEAKVDKVVSNFQKRIERHAEFIGSTPIPTGSRLQSSVDLKSSRWNDAIVELIELAQIVAKNWTITGAVSDDFSLVATGRITVAGVELIECGIRRS